MYSKGQIIYSHFRSEIVEYEVLTVTETSSYDEVSYRYTIRRIKDGLCINISEGNPNYFEDRKVAIADGLCYAEIVLQENPKRVQELIDAMERAKNFLKLNGLK